MFKHSSKREHNLHLGNASVAAKPGTKVRERIQAAYLALIGTLPKGGGRAQGLRYSLSAPLPWLCSVLALSSEGIAREASACQDAICDKDARYLCAAPLVWLCQEAGPLLLF